MSKTTHTPGPWEFAVSGTAYSITADAEPVYIATVEIPDRMSKVPQAKANARLIAAAPDLLDACRRMLAILDTVAADPGPCATHLTAVREAARAAIAKATNA